MIRLLLADDHPVVRAGLRAVLELEPDFVVVAEEATAEAAVVRAGRGDVDVVLMDLQFGDRLDGIDATQRIRALPDPPRVVVLTTYDIEGDVLAAIGAGAAGYLLKDAEPGEMARAIRAGTGDTVLAPRVAQRLVRRSLQPDTALSARELEVLGSVAEGLSNEAIGRRMFLSQATVKSHLVHVFSKLGVESRTAAVAAARERRLIR
ncbi:MAG TPA: response regulator transcription factor [Nocardioidaceae bacterium]|jgi:DNA-binding NarL/FixJ family response regulator|nr:response regulator transcription factor [Nocardioidaceae bacterium]